MSAAAPTDPAPPRGEHIHTYFGLSYASHVVLPRTLLQSMPDKWQRRMVRLLEEFDAAFPQHPGEYRIIPGRWVLCTEGDPDVLHALGYDRGAGGEWTDPDGRVTSYAFIPGADPTPPYDRGRAFVQPDLDAVRAVRGSRALRAQTEPEDQSGEAGAGDHNNVIPLRPEPGGYDGLICGCGSAWFDAKVCVDAEARVTGRTLGLHCVECNTPVDL